MGCSSKQLAGCTVLMLCVSHVVSGYLVTDAQARRPARQSGQDSVEWPTRSGSTGLNTFTRPTTRRQPGADVYKIPSTRKPSDPYGFPRPTRRRPAYKYPGPRTTRHNFPKPTKSRPTGLYPSHGRTTPQSTSRPVNAKHTSRRPIFTSDNETAILECAFYNCRESLCYIPHPLNCFKYIMCQTLDNGVINSQVMPCAFGTMWKAGLSTPTCQRAQDVECTNDVCRFANDGASYEHDDGNCRTYYSCNNGRSTPKCCARNQRYDIISEKCVTDITCGDLCPLINDATCTGLGVKSISFPDGNCKTYFDCNKGHPHPVCCPDGHGYDVLKGICVPNYSCKDVCPPEYQDMCSKRGVSSYDLIDNNCRTYMKCNELGQDDPWCCSVGFLYSARYNMCVNASHDDIKCLHERCPPGYNKIGYGVANCMLRPVETSPYYYQNMNAFGTPIMPCPVGTTFNSTTCACTIDPKVMRKDKGCSLSIHLFLPSLLNHGATIASIKKIGKYKEIANGKIYNGDLKGNKSCFWDGSSGFNIMYYAYATISKFYLEVDLKPTSSAIAEQVLLSSCESEGNELGLAIIFYPSGGPSQRGIIRVWVKPLGSTVKGLSLKVPYTVNVSYKLRVIYDGSLIALWLQNTDGNSAGHVVSDIRRLRGKIPISKNGLQFAQCFQSTSSQYSSFVGFISEVKFKNCILPEDTIFLAFKLKKKPSWRITRPSSQTDKTTVNPFVTRSTDAPYVPPSTDAPYVPPSTDAPYVPPTKDAQYVPQSTDAPYIPQFTDMPYALPSTDNPYVPPSTDALYVLPSTDAPYVFPSTDAPYVPLSTDAPYVSPSTGTPYVPSSTDAPYVPPSTDAQYVPPSTDAQYVPPSTDAPYVSQSTYTPYVPPSTDAPYVPPSTDAPYVPPTTDAPYVPPSTDAPYAPPFTDAPFVVPSTNVTYIPSSTDAPYVPPSTGTPYVPSSTDAPYTPTSTDAPYVPPSTDAAYVPISTDAQYVSPTTEAPYAPANTNAPYVPTNTDAPYVPPSTDGPYVPPSTDAPHVPPTTNSLFGVSNVDMFASKPAEVPNVPVVNEEPNGFANVEWP